MTDPDKGSNAPKSDVTQQKPEEPILQLKELEESVNNAFSVKSGEIIKSEWLKVTKPPLSGLVDRVKSILQHYCDFYKVPIEYALAPMMCAVSCAAGTKVQTYNGKDYNYLSLWLPIIGGKGTGKSRGAKAFFKPLFAINEELFNQYKVAKKSYDQRFRESKGNLDENPPVPHTLISNLVTDERRNIQLSENPFGVLQYNEEISSFFASLGKYTGKADNGTLIDISDNNTYSVDTIRGGYIMVKNPYLTIFGGIQPKIAKKYFCASDTSDSGLTDRFFFFWPYEKKTEKEDLFANNNTIKSHLDNWCVWIDEMYRRNNELQDTRIITFTKSAMMLADAFYEECNILQKATLSEDEYSIVSKVRKGLWKFCGIAHMINEKANMVFNSPNVTDNEMLWAISMCKYFYQTYMKLVGNDKLAVSKSDLIMQIRTLNPEASPTDIAKILNINVSTVKTIIRRN